jgi:hypothetical protein
MKRRIAAFVVALAVSSPGLLAVDGDAAQYLGGTMPIAEKAEGKLVTSAETHVAFQPKKKGQTAVEIPYASITELEYGQKAGRRVAVAVMVSPLALFSKKRNHYLTITYNDASGKEQTGVFELGKDIIRTTLKILEVRSGKDVQYQDEEARKSGLGS